MSKGKGIAHVLPMVGAVCASLLIVILAFLFNLESSQDVQDASAKEDAPLVEIEPSALPLSQFEGADMPVEEGSEDATDAADDELDPSAARTHDGTVPDQDAIATPDASTGNAAAALPQAQPQGTIRVLDRDIPYAYTYGITYAPDEGCGIWKGVASVDDGGYAFFVGHNPGDFASVMQLSLGDVVTVCDDEGKSRQYAVQDAFVLPQRTTFQDIEERVTGHGESVVLQTCCGDNVNIRVVVAW